MHDVDTDGVGEVFDPQTQRCGRGLSVPLPRRERAQGRDNEEMVAQGALTRAVCPLRPVPLNAATRTVPRKGIGPLTTALRAVGSVPSVV